MKLAIISHTEHYRDINNNIVGWGPTVREINHLIQIFDEIYHVAPLHHEVPPDSSLAYDNNKIHFIPLPQTGGKTFWQKIKILLKAPIVLHIINKNIKKVDCIQFRAPTGIGIYVLPYLLFKPKLNKWIKYAGNWKQEKPPLSYAFQKWFLNKNFLKCRVTINGQWDVQKPHLISFINPCLDEYELKEGAKTVSTKEFVKKFVFTFVGRIEQAKGVSIILDMLEMMDSTEWIEKIYFVGEGDERKNFEEKAKRIDIPIHFTGSLARKELNEIYSETHFLLLPTIASEGFPKVIAEAANYGCIPVVSDISSIPQYIKDGVNGFLIQTPTPQTLGNKLQTIVTNLQSEELMIIAKNANLFSAQFTYTSYNKQLLEKVINE